MAKPVLLLPETTTRTKVWQPSGYGGIEIGMKSSSAVLEFPKHLIQGYTIVLNGMGEGKVDYESQHYTFTNVQNLIFLQNPGEVFSGRFWGESGASGACIVLPRSHLNRLLDSIEVNQTGFFEDLLLPKRANALVAKQVADLIGTFATPTSRLERESKLLSSLETVFRYGSTVNVPQLSLGKERTAIAIIKEILHANPGENHSISSLSMATGLNPKYLIDVFTKNIGLPPHRYLTNLRIHQAKSRLVKGDVIANVAVDLGFYDQSHFSKTFKRYVRVSPKQFQQDSAQNN